MISGVMCSPFTRSLLQLHCRTLQDHQQCGNQGSGHVCGHLRPALADLPVPGRAQLERCQLELPSGHARLQGGGLLRRADHLAAGRQAPELRSRRPDGNILHPEQ